MNLLAPILFGVAFVLVMGSVLAGVGYAYYLAWKYRDWEPALIATFVLGMSLLGASVAVVEFTRNL